MLSVIAAITPLEFPDCQRGMFRQVRGMRQSHEWHEKDEETGQWRYYRARKFGKTWDIKTTLKSDADWQHPDPVPLYILESLRSQLENKYARRRVPYNHLVAVDRLVAAAGGVAKHAEAKEE
jgi:hypothetical protein